MIPNSGPNAITWLKAGDAPLGRLRISRILGEVVAPLPVRQSKSQSSAGTVTPALSNMVLL